MRLSLLYITLLIFVSCKQKVQSVDDTIIITSSKVGEELISTINLELLEFEYDEPVGIGLTLLHNENFYFIDRLSTQILEFDFEGNFKRKPITKGEGPSEIQRFHTVYFGKDQFYFISGYTVSVFNKDFNLVRRFELDFEHGSTLHEIEHNPTPDNPAVYELKYWGNQVFENNGFFYVKIESSNPKFNGYDHREYYLYGGTYGEFDLKTGKATRVLGKRPPVYLNYSHITYLDLYYHDVHEKEIYLSFEPDSLIYITDMEFNVKEAFGVKGIGMHQDYIETKHHEEASNLVFRMNKIQKGYYKYVKHFHEDGITFRTYTLGIPNDTVLEHGTNPQRMQIYKDKALVGDVEVPTSFAIIGKIGDYYYADGSGGNPNNEEIIVYKFKLE
ncbi:hypothetical protein [Belliella aquatica]|uniref:6-bladed beta-propeller n=1 Tax=Belliella aquatica TaxID=1323734 RepID=A0ABQ1MNJ7_9BACT|nr:hypothetical protein [Belliella aquatica]MCH7405287.1 hypothetical protein [Belliella aquatica]GGC42894.1 hypothetical protein GCM10010993_21810 [Belliella aquatica]